MKKLTLTCSNCGIKFQRDESKVLQTQRQGTVNFYHNTACSVEGNRKNRTGWRNKGIYLGESKNK